jgi:hypothetical protein
MVYKMISGEFEHPAHPLDLGSESSEDTFLTGMYIPEWLRVNRSTVYQEWETDRIRDSMPSINEMKGGTQKVPRLGILLQPIRISRFQRAGVLIGAVDFRKGHRLLTACIPGRIPGVVMQSLLRMKAPVQCID